MIYVKLTTMAMAMALALALVLAMALAMARDYLKKPPYLGGFIIAGIA